MTTCAHLQTACRGEAPTRPKWGPHMLMDLCAPDAPVELSTDICIIGAGAAGITIAERLGRQGYDVLLLEGGSLAIDDRMQQLFLGDSIGAPIAVEEGRYRVFGGTTTRWRGRCATLDPADFEQRDWIAGSGWPIGLAALAPHYEEAKDYCGFKEAWRPDQEIYERRIGKAFDGQDALVRPFVWRFAPKGRAMYQNWAVRFGPFLRKSKNVRVMVNANATRLIPAPSNDHVVAVEGRSIRGDTVRVNARSIVMACGGIENARLALNFAESAPPLFGKVANNLGRYFMQHPKAVTAQILPGPGMELRLQRMLNLFLQPRGTQYEVGLALSEEAQRSFKLVNCSGHFRYTEGDETGWRHFKSLGVRGGDLAAMKTHLNGVLSDFRPVARNIWRRAFGRTSLLPSPEMTLVTDIEQVPDPESRIQLSAHRDGLGLRRACLDWRISSIEERTALHFTTFVDAAFRRLGLGRLKIDEELQNRGVLHEGILRESYHHIGATRMSETAEFGVVAPNSAVHGIDNLYITGASVMPTGGHANPTLTIVALALRLANHLAQSRPR